MKAGGRVEIFGVGFPARSKLNLYAGQIAPYDEIVMRNVGETDGDGVINTSITLSPEFKPGRYMIHLADEHRSVRTGGTPFMVE